MTKQELIQALKAKRKLSYNRYFAASKKWEDNLKLFGSTENVVVRLDSEKMEAENARIEEINDLIHLVETLED